MPAAIVARAARRSRPMGGPQHEHEHRRAERGRLLDGAAVVVVGSRRW